MNLTTLDECEAALLAFVPAARSEREVYTLERVQALMQVLGNPQNNYQVVHVAGTSGKTSTCYYAAAILSEAGLKTGLTVSPHITRVNERVQINLEPASEALFAQELTTFLELVKKSDLKPTYYEVLMAFAYWFFDRQKVDVAVIETGIGGLLDGSNVVQNPSKLCILTDIGLDHTALLGNTLPEIAAQKAGIIGEGNKVFCHSQDPLILDVFKDAANQKHADLRVIEHAHSRMPQHLALFQQRNFALAAEACASLLENTFNKPISSEVLDAAAHQHIPARMEHFKVNGKNVILDAAHNPQKMEAFVQSYKHAYPGTTPAVLYACIEGPDAKVEQTIHQLLKLEPTKIIVTSFQSLQDMKKLSETPQKLTDYFKAENYQNTEVMNDPNQALEAILEAGENILVVGSLYLVFEVREQLIRLADGQR